MFWTICIVSLVQTESRKRKRKLEDGDQDYEPDDDSGGSTLRCPVKKHECRLYELYRSKWWVQSSLVLLTLV